MLIYGDIKNTSVYIGLVRSSWSAEDVSELYSLLLAALIACFLAVIWFLNWYALLLSDFFPGSLYFICLCTRGKVCVLFGWTRLGEPLCCRLVFALSDLWLLWLQPEMLVFQCSDTELCNSLIRHHWNCITCRQNGNMPSDVTKQRSRLLEKAEKTLGSWQDRSGL